MKSLSRATFASRVRWLVLAAGTTLPAQAVAQGRPVLARIADDSRVVSVDPATGSERTLYNIDLSVAWLRDVRVAPSGEFIAVLQSSQGRVRGLEYDRLPRNRLVLLDTAGGIVEAIEHDVRRFVWCCGGQSLALITGRYHEGGLGFLSDSVFILNVATRAERLLTPPVRPVEVAWAPFDTSVYLGALAPDDGLEVWRYHVPSGNLTRTSYRGLSFSPSGAYYLASSTGLRTRPGWHLVHRDSGREIALPDTSEGVVRGWAFAEGDQLLLMHQRIERVGPAPPQGRPQAMMGRVTANRYAVYDVRTRRVTQRGSGSIPRGASASGGLVLIEQDGRIAVLRGPTR